MSEIWKDIPGFEGHYKVSNLGRVKSVKKITEKILTPISDGRGYVKFCLCKNGNTKSFKAHRLVAINFIVNTNNKPCVNHINGIKDDNRVENLEWSSYSENEKHSFDVLGKKITHSHETRKKMSILRKGKDMTKVYMAAAKKRIGLPNINRKQVVLNKTHIYESITIAANKNGISCAAIHKNLKGLSKKTKVGVWEYLQER